MNTFYRVMIYMNNFMIDDTYKLILVIGNKVLHALTGVCLDH